MSEVANYLRSSNAEQAKLNQILQTLQKLLTPVTGDPKKELIVYAPENKVRLTSVTTGEANIKNTDDRDRLNSLVKTLHSATLSSYPLNKSLVFSFLQL